MGTYDTIVRNIEYYNSLGFRTAADVILCADNYDQMYEIIRTAANLGMSEVYVNRFQGGGFGAAVINKLMPPLEMFRAALTQIISGRDDFRIPVVFGTSIPLCIDDRLVTRGFEFNCHMGVKFGAVAPDGEMRACNQALCGYGNITVTPLEQIWQSPALDEYRDYRWVTGICVDCPLLERCGGGCRVDNSQLANYCPDAFVRYLDRRPDVVDRIIASEANNQTPRVVPRSPQTGKRRLRAEEGLILIRKHPEKYIVRDNYSTLVVDDVCVDLCSATQSDYCDERTAWAFVRRNKPELSDELLGRYVDHLGDCGVLTTTPH